MISKKRKQHYVFQAYLSAWTENNQLWCKRPDCEPFKTTTMNVGQERDFYRIKPLNIHEIKFLELFLPEMSQESKKAFFDHIDHYLMPLKYQTLVQKIKQEFELKFDRSIPEKIKNQISQLEEFVDVMINNAEEDYYSDIEGDAIVWIDLLKMGDSSFYYKNDVEKNDFFDDNNFDFLFSICTQYFRTKAIKERWISNAGFILNELRSKNAKFNECNINLENITHHYFWYTKNACAYLLHKNNSHLTVLINETDIPFITSDQPVINLKADYQNLSEVSTELVFFYPISPNIAIAVNDDNIEKRLLITNEQVDEYNSAIIASSFQNIFSSSEDIFERYSHLL
ncbi:MAG: hypothetical protein CVU92_01670 [Firmicutes bacterium HGW-Firmicutes-17]|nr:MAG: hypothetical protein CVU92_01670 [Firmicutes bacterium HGW-Firmicutes-17]